MAVEAYTRLERIFARLNVLDDVLGVLHWDMSTMMPEGGAEARAEQLATLRSLHHDMLTASQVVELLDGAEAERSALNAWQAANLREMRRDWVHAAAVPGDLVDALSRAVSTCEMAWRAARPASDFKAVRPLLEEVLRLVRETAQAKAAKLGTGAYDALLDQYEPGGGRRRSITCFRISNPFCQHSCRKSSNAAVTLGRSPRPARSRSNGSELWPCG